MSGYTALLRPALFRYRGGDAEAAHEATLDWLSRLPRVAGRRAYAPAGAARTVFGVRFPNPVGLAAGLDKDGRALHAWPALGFGFVELGSVTWDPQPGNPKPRLFRLPDSEAIVNRMGFNNAGARALARRLAEGDRPGVPVGISLGKSKLTPLDAAVAEYVASFRELHRYGDYFAVNVSSPNTPGLRRLQDADHLRDLLAGLRSEARALAAGGAPRPILVKIAPDLTDAALGELLGVCAEQGVAGVVATNTTLSRSGLAAGDAARGVPAGGLSGRPLAARALLVVRFVVRESGLPVVGVGGIMSVDDARRMIDAGASLIQLCSGLVYHGPALVRSCVRALAGSVTAPTGG